MIIEAQKYAKKIKAQNHGGFVSIIALGIFALMMIFAISLQMTTMDTLQSIKNSDNYLSAKITADSMMEYLQWKMKNYEVGWNTGEVICGFGKYEDQTTIVEGGGAIRVLSRPWFAGNGYS